MWKCTVVKTRHNALNIRTALFCKTCVALFPTSKRHEIPESWMCSAIEMFLNNDNVEIILWLKLSRDNYVICVQCKCSPLVI